MIKATGIKNNKRITVIYDNDKFLFDGKENFHYEAIIRVEMEMKHSIGGTYYAEEINDPVNIAGVLRNHFFDSPTLDIESDEPLDIPSEEGVIY